MSFTDEEIEEFKCEAIELLDSAEASLLSLSEGGPFKENYETIFRSFHNLKGAAGMMEWNDLLKHTHEVETIFTEFKGEKALPGPAIDFFLRAVDGARSILNGEKIEFVYALDAMAPAPILDNPKEAEKVEVDTKNELESAFNEYICECEEIIERISKALLSLESNGYDKELVDSVYREVHSLKGASYLFDCQSIGELAHAMETAMEPIRQDGLALTKPMIDMIYSALEIVEIEIENFKNPKKPRKTANKIKKLCEKFSSLENPKPLPVVEKEVPLAQDSVPPIEEPMETQKPEDSQQSAIPDKEGGNSSIRVSVQLLDKLMALMGEMVLVRNQVLQYTQNSDDLDFLNLSKRLNVVTSEIQEEMMKTRMQPIGNVVNKFQRVVRDLSGSLKKDLSLTIEGADTELDKSLLESIKDPLTHIVRNSCDHGLETPAERKAQGKSGQGHILIKAYHEGGQVVVKVQDDGRGLNKKRILEKAIEKGIISFADSERLTDQEVHNLIFSPGFSTAATVTSVSGRGVGMDVVATNIESIGGTVDIESREGRGTTILLKIPLTLAIVPALIVNCASNTFAIPQVKLVELVRVDQGSAEDRIELLQGTPVYRLRGKILPLIDLRKVLDLEGENKRDFDQADMVNIAVVQADGGMYGLIVDGVRDTADIVVKPLNRLLKSLQVYSGATVLGDGSVALIVDVQGITRAVDIRAAQEKAEASLGHGSDLEAKEMSELQDYLLVGLNSPTKHAFVLNYVHRLEEFKIRDIEYSGNRRVVRYRGRILPLVSCNEALGYKENQWEDDASMPVIVVERAGRLFGLEVNGILDTLVTEVEPQENIDAKSGIVGHLNLESELVALVDPFDIISHSFPEMDSVQKQANQASQVALPEISGKMEQIASVNQMISEARVLIVEDTSFFRKMIQAALIKAGHQVTFAVDGREALDLLNKVELPFDIIISDIEMPRMNGFNLAEEIRKHPIHKNTPLLALSSKADQTYRQKGREVGFNFYMEKFKPETLNQKVNELLDKAKEAA